MTRKQIILRLKQVLLRRREALRKSLDGELVGGFNTTSERYVGDTVDEALDSDYGMVNSQLAETESRELVAIENALERLRQREYGVCESCGGTIPVARLRALPYATTCVACQRSTERRRSPGSSSSDWSRVEDARESSDRLSIDMLELVAQS